MTDTFFPLIEWTFRETPLKQLKKYDKNPRSLTQYQENTITESLSKFGLCENIVANKDNTIIGGHQRHRLLQKNGIETAIVAFPNRLLTQKEVEELNIRLNKNHADFDDDLLANFFDLDDLLEWGFTHDELDIEMPTSKKKPNKKKYKLTVTSDSIEKIAKIETEIAEIAEREGCVFKLST